MTADNRAPKPQVTDKDIAAAVRRNTPAVAKRRRVAKDVLYKSKKK